MPAAAELQIVIEAVDKSSAQLRQIGQAVQRLEGQVERVQRSAGGGLLGGLNVGAGIAAAQQAFGALGGVIDFIKTSVVDLNSALERNVATFEQVTGSASAAADVVAALRREAATSPFSDREILDAGRALISVSERSTESLLELVRVAEVLASIDPAQGFEGATVALREALSGDFGSFIRRFEASRESIQRFKDEGVSNLEIVRRELERMGYTTALVERLGQTFEGRAATIRSFFDELRQRAGAGLFDRLNDLFGRLVRLIDDFGDQLRVLATGIGTALGAIAETIGAALIGPLRALSESLAPGLWDQLVASMERVPPAIERTGQAADRAGPAVEDVTRRLARLGVEAAGLQLDADRVRRAYDDQIQPLERQLRLLQQSADLQRVQNALASNRALEERVRLTAELQALERAGAAADPNAPDLTPRQRALALALQERRLRLEELGLEAERRPQIQTLEQAIARLQEQQRAALEPLERSLALRKDEIDAIQLVRKQEEQLAGAVAATAKARMDGWTAQNPGALDEVKKRGEELATSWLEGWQKWIDANGGNVWTALQRTLEAWYENTGKPAAQRIGRDIGETIGKAAAEAIELAFGPQLERLERLEQFLTNLRKLFTESAAGQTADEVVRRREAERPGIGVSPRVAQTSPDVVQAGGGGVTVNVAMTGIADAVLGEKLRVALQDFLARFLLAEAGVEPGTTRPLAGNTR